ncbi:transcription-repair coupling factor [Thermoclostridium stercorarium subsp. leptospartum DSM 9219]|uniref:Transcription-repair-coupling factor n=2 Tax=Thermoclostridium stercorarium TaxID=1510 RepID=A0A1B1YNG3_THEST|nr:transcription-repair coupling factor [Thermoclostridium stercorarium]ANX02327.1 transcription-repair coupling factor [Thermoclostridium stercorarium subsp. leptospartum DSM 9219]
MNSIRFDNWEKFRNIISDISNGYSISLNGLTETQRHHFIYSIIAKAGRKALYIAANDLQARNALESFSGMAAGKVLYFPFREKMLYDVEAKSYDQAYQRIEILDCLLRQDFDIAVLSCESLIDIFMPPEEFAACRLSFKTGDTVDLEKLISDLARLGYERENEVEGSGQFAVRGGIIDIFPIQMREPVRIELFDIEIDSIRVFDPESQRSVQGIDRVEILPAKEFILSKEQALKAAGRIRRELREVVSRTDDKDLVNSLNKNFENYIEKLENAEYFAGIDKFIPYFYDENHSLLDYVGRDSLLFVEDVARLRQRLKNVVEEYHNQCEVLLDKGMLLPGSFLMYSDPEDLPGRFARFQTVYLNSLDEGETLTEVKKQYSLYGNNTVSYAGRIDELKKDIKAWLEKGYQITIQAMSDQRKEGLKNFLEENGIRVYSEYPKDDTPCVVIKTGQLKNGFVYPEIKWAVLCESDIVAGKKKRAAHQHKTGKKIDVFTDLTVGDYVVHQVHGIGVYKGIESLTVEGVKSEYLKIEYRDGGFLYIPITQLDLIQKYIGTEGKAPKINKLGGAEWTRQKKKVKEALKELAEELIRLEAERASMEGYAFSPDTVWQKQFEEAFEWEETEDQLRCTEEIKSDMESKKPMDRLLCGDVGYGKTEVALRAVFKAAMDGKQSAFLVPTTVLAAQHYENFKKRFAQFPITVEMLSRFRTESEQKRIIRDLKAGKIDVIIGTHKLFNKEVRFKDLGLLVIDEEHRFGVEQKEKIKRMYPRVDILTLSATPIPRTLHMSLTGIRDISIIEQPPEHRYPVQTYVLEYNEDVIADAIRREIARDGQVFYLYNRVKGIQAKAVSLQEMLGGQVRVGYAHGQMNERQLEKIITSFINREFDVLVCTTIIESGIDMPNVNTIIVEDADRLGLAQLYQLRGRVGRSNRLAYAYLTYKRDKVLNETAEKRLKAIREFTEFGSGFKIAMRDLQIRGAGNLLGPEQHGHMEAVGYDTYVRLLEETIKELKGEAVPQEDIEVNVDLKISAYLDSQYIPDEQARLDMYKTISAVENEEEAIDVYDELLDRFGDVPEEASNLIKIVLIRKLAAKCGFNVIKQKDDTVLMYFKEQNALPLPLLSRLVHEEKGRIMFSAGKNPYLSYKVKGLSPSEMLDNIKILLQRVQKLQSG